MYLRIVTCLVFVTLCAIPLNAQSWNSAEYVSPSQIFDYDDLITSYTNPEAHHVLLHEGNQIVYYQLDYDGVILSSSTVVSSISEDQRLAGIGGYENTLYIVYVEDDDIITERSTNSGSTWSTSITDVSMIDGNSNGLSIAVDDGYAHIAYSEYDDSNEEYHTYYRSIGHASYSWSSAYQVTNTTGDYGGMPKIALSSSRIHVLYTKGNNNDLADGANGVIKVRDKYSSTWQTPQIVESSSDGIAGNIIADGSKLHCIYFKADGSIAEVYSRTRTLSSTTWSSSTLLDDYSEGDYSIPDLTLDNTGNTHVVYAELNGDDDDTHFRKYISSWGSPSSIYESDGPQISNDYNDLYVVCRAFYGPARCMLIRQYDANPPATTLAINTSGTHPVLSWTKVSLDAKEYKVYRKVVGVADWHLKTTTSNLTWTDSGVWIEDDFMTIYYRIQAYDQEDNTSGWSNEVVCSGDAMNKPLAEGLSESGNMVIPNDYNLRHNYPNPFNPSTTIKFDLPEDNHVNLVVFNLNGQKVANLVDTFVPAGSYKVNFNAGDLPSGVYFYQITAGGFRDIKRMLLIK